MTVIEARFRIVTPMFLGDAEQKATAIRPPSIKGALRFWWRALNWERILQTNNGNGVAGLAALHKSESQIFGAPAEQGGQASFLLRITEHDSMAHQTADFTNPWLGYLLGQGLYHFKTHLAREYLGGSFSIELRFRPGTRAAAIQEVEQAVLLFGLLGGLGSRARRGFGSVAIESLSRDRQQATLPQDQKAYRQQLRTLIGSSVSPLPPFTAFSSKTRMVMVSGEQDALKTLSLAGKEMQMYRGWGRHGKINGLEAEQNFADDHDFAQAVTNGQKPDATPKRAAFGLPHNYFFSSTNGKVDITLSADKISRRASPLLIHLHRLPSGQHLLVQTVMPATFAAQGHRIEFKVKPPKGGRPATHMLAAPREPDWSILERYLQRFKTAEQVIP